MKIKLLGVIFLSVLGTASLGTEVLANGEVDSKMNLQIESEGGGGSPAIKSIDTVDFANIKSTIEKQKVYPKGDPKIIISNAHTKGFKVQVKMSQELVPGSVLRLGNYRAIVDEGIIKNYIDVNEDYKIFAAGQSEVEGDRALTIEPELELPANVPSGNYAGTLNWNLVVAL